MNGILLVDKPPDFTSHDVVAKLRGMLHERRIGHSGTLDPMATGLLVVFVGRATRAVEFTESDEKEYIAGIRTGLATDTQDISGTVLSSCGHRPAREEFAAALPAFLGEQQQIPPMYSAIKIGGKKLCDLARKGIEVERRPRTITIHALELLGENNGDFLLRVACSKGTYVRTLADDIGRKLGTGAALSSLRRTRAGAFSVENAHTLAEIQAFADRGEAQSLLLAVDSLFDEFPAVTLSAEQRKKCLVGAKFPFSAEDGDYRVYGPDGDFLMLGRIEAGEVRTIKSFFEI